MTTTGYIGRRLLQIVPVMLFVVTVTFVLINSIPGDPVRILVGPAADAAAIEAARAKYGLDQPLYVRYVRYLAAVATGDFGTSIHYGGVAVTEKIFERLPVTLLLLASSFTLAIGTAIPLGIFAAKNRNNGYDHLARVTSLIGVSTPSFWVGLLLIIVFAYYGDLLPPSGLIMPWADPASVDGATSRLDVLVTAASHLILPSITLGTLQMAAITRIERSSMLEVLNKDYVQLARAYGVSERTILRRQAFKNAQLPVLTVIGIQMTTALGGAVLTETVFNINGMGNLIITAVRAQDYQLIMGTTIFFAIVFVLGVLVVDVLYAVIDPRISYGGGSGE
ncbi:MULTISPECIES: ABC transporter permease [Haloferax]|uniref:ABC transporter permease n=3 Tax=Haloferax TaxID=2251 RepID=A0A0K1IYE8_HALGI|nr:MULTISPECIES: ABC transporter permease [Haloferax]AKU09491.1 ABC transporter permease [Haloferax gibbonsii]QOS13352.1 ABC-type transport system permease protein (probable substrate dipeptide/oligopeptide) [Haloferax gibbonsii]